MTPPEEGAQVPEPWELDYPHRDTYWRVHWPNPTPQGVWSVPEGLSEAEAIRRAQVAAAHELERFARVIMGGHQFTGVQLSQRLVVVDDAARARDIAKVWRAAPRDAEVQALVDRAVGCLRQCLDRGVRVLEWDRPGYDDVTRSYRELDGFASDRSVTPVVLAWEPDFQGEPLLPRVASPGSRAPARTVATKLRAGAARVLPWILLAAGVPLIAWRVLHRPSAPASGPPAPLDCAGEHATLRSRLAHDPDGSLADDPVARAEALERFDRGDLVGAGKRLSASQAEGVHLLSVELFIYRQECGAGGVRRP